MGPRRWGRAGGRGVEERARWRREEPKLAGRLEAVRGPQARHHHRREPQVLAEAICVSAVGAAGGDRGAWRPRGSPFGGGEFRRGLRREFGCGGGPGRSAARGPLVGQGSSPCPVGLPTDHGPGRPR
jgi:hypothetical protein